jgi:tRNA 2-thiouridine synthesizing protein D
VYAKAFFKPMKYAIQINGAPDQSQSVYSAQQFIKAALAEGHEIIRVFFYHQGIYNGFGAEASWSALARQYGLDLVLCVSAVERRGMDPSVAARLREGFRLGGLAQWVEAALKADRTLMFGG